MAVSGCLSLSVCLFVYLSLSVALAPPESIEKHAVAAERLTLAPLAPPGAIEKHAVAACLTVCLSCRALSVCLSVCLSVGMLACM